MSRQSSTASTNASGSVGSARMFGSASGCALGSAKASRSVPRDFGATSPAAIVYPCSGTGYPSAGQGMWINSGCRSGGPSQWVLRAYSCASSRLFSPAGSGRVASYRLLTSG